MGRSIDPAALAAATLAAAVAVMMGQGPYNAFSAAIGLTLLFILRGYGSSPPSDAWQTAAVAAVRAICVALIVAYLLEVAIRALGAAPKSAADSAIRPGLMFAVWVLLFTVFFLRGRLHLAEAPAKAEAAQPHVVTVHKLFKPASPDKLLEGWLRHAHKQRDRHDFSARHFDRRGNITSTLAVVLSAIVGTAVFVSLTKSEWWPLQIGAGVLSVVAAVMTAVHRNFNDAERAERHRVAAGRYKSLIWRLEEETAKQAGPAPDLSDIGKTLQTLEIESPVVPWDIYDAIEARYTTVKFVDDAEKLTGEKGVSFDEAATVFDDDRQITIPDPDHSIGEFRHVTIGMTTDGQLVVVSHTEDDDDRIRIISVRIANARERRTYDEGLRNPAE